MANDAQAQLKPGETLDDPRNVAPPIAAQPATTTDHPALRKGETLDEPRVAPPPPAESEDTDKTWGSVAGIPYKKESFNPAHMASEAGHGLMDMAGGIYQMGEDAFGGAPVVQGKNSMLNKYVLDPARAEEGKATKALAQDPSHPIRNQIESFGHGLAAAIPMVGPWAASLGEQAGTGDVGGAMAKGGAQYASPLIAMKGMEVAAKPFKFVNNIYKYTNRAGEEHNNAILIYNRMKENNPNANPIDLWDAAENTGKTPWGKDIIKAMQRDRNFDPMAQGTSGEPPTQAMPTPIPYAKGSKANPGPPIPAAPEAMPVPKTVNDIVDKAIPPLKPQGAPNPAPGNNGSGAPPEARAVPRPEPKPVLPGGEGAALPTPTKGPGSPLPGGEGTLPEPTKGPGSAGWSKEVDEATTPTPQSQAPRPAKEPVLPGSAGTLPTPADLTYSNHPAGEAGTVWSQAGKKAEPAGGAAHETDLAAAQARKGAHINGQEFHDSIANDQDMLQKFGAGKGKGQISNTEIASAHEAITGKKIEVGRGADKTGRDVALKNMTDVGATAQDIYKAGKASTTVQVPGDDFSSKAPGKYGKTLRTTDAVNEENGTGKPPKEGPGTAAADSADFEGHPNTATDAEGGTHFANAHGDWEPMNPGQGTYRSEPRGVLARVEAQTNAAIAKHGLVPEPTAPSVSDLGAPAPKSWRGWKPRPTPP